MPDGPATRAPAPIVLDLGVLEQRLPLDQHYTTEFVPVGI
jgi:hypothetical protein